MALIYRQLAGSTQVKIESFADLREAVTIPETQWVATSVPLSTLVADPRFLDLLDADDNNRVRVDEVQAAVAWMSDKLNDFSGVDKKSDVLVLANVKDEALKDAIDAASQAVRQRTASR